MGRKEEGEWLINKVILIGRLTSDPDTRYTQGEDPICVARYTLAVDRKTKKQDGGYEADFIHCIAFRKAGEFAYKYLHQGMKIAIVGHIQTGSYTNREGQKVYTTDIIVEEHDFCEKKQEEHLPEPKTDSDGFMNIPDDIDDEGLPFN